MSSGDTSRRQRIESELLTRSCCTQNGFYVNVGLPAVYQTPCLCPHVWCQCGSSRFIIHCLWSSSGVVSSLVDISQHHILLPPLSTCTDYNKLQVICCFFFLLAPLEGKNTLNYLVFWNPKHMLKCPLGSHTTHQSVLLGAKHMPECPLWGLTPKANFGGKKHAKVPFWEPEHMLRCLLWSHTK